MTNRLSDTIMEAIKREIRKIHTCLPAEVENYDNKTRKASVKPAIKPIIEGEEIELPLISSIPVVFPSTNKATMSFPLEKGDPVLLLFSERSLENWLNVKGKAKEKDTRQFALSDAIAIPGLWDFKSVPQGSQDGIFFQNEQGKIRLQNGKVALGTDTNELLDLFSSLANTLANITIVDPQSGTDLWAPYKSSFVDLKAKIDSIKGSL